jgi:hypothetical protein
LVQMAPVVIPAIPIDLLAQTPYIVVKQQVPSTRVMLHAVRHVSYHMLRRLASSSCLPPQIANLGNDVGAARLLMRSLICSWIMPCSMLEAVGSSCLGRGPVRWPGLRVSGIRGTSQVEMMEMLTGFETANKYKIKNQFGQARCCIVRSVCMLHATLLSSIE